MRHFAIVLFFALAAFAQTSVWQPSAGHTQIPLWPGKPPNAVPLQAPESVAQSDNFVAGKRWTYISNVATPTITVYTPQRNRAAASKTTAVIVLPGGGYKILAIDLEGTEVCDWLTAKGVACVVLKYRVPYSGHYWDDKCRCHVTPPAPLALQDAQRAISMVRARAAEWNIDPHKIGLLGFSAGGHLSAAVSTHFNRRSYAPVDAADRESCRPDFAVALYPGHLWTDESKFKLDPDIQVTKATSPTFLLHAQNDPVDDVNHTLVYYLALRKAGVPTELHIYPHGGHAFGLRPTREPITHWPELVEKWIATLW